jgi:hypothetical protein
MSIPNALFPKAGPAVAVLFVCALLWFCAHGEDQTDFAACTSAPGVILVQTATAEEEAELPAALFAHDRHVATLTERRQDPCTLCHMPEPLTPGKGFSFSFSDVAQAGKESAETFHAGCIGCHEESVKAGLPAGPAETACRSCHRVAVSVPDHNSMDFDKTLHFKHIASPSVRPVDASGRNCEACHHAFDDAAGKLVPATGREDSCRACHGPYAGRSSGQKKPLGLKSAAHRACVNCHLSNTPEYAAKTGPVNCIGCHNQKKEARAGEAVAVVPRLLRGQPDSVLMTSEGEEESPASARPVLFRHAAHENVVDSCRTCHHREIGACSGCHSPGGRKEGAFVTLSTAVHKPEMMRSCVGCHNTAKQDPACAGCHALQKTTVSAGACAACHISSAKTGVARSPADLSGAPKPNIAVPNAVPETVHIGVSAAEHAPVNFPHAQIVSALKEKQVGNALGRAFHTETTLCATCHHADASLGSISRCISCHETDTKMLSADGRPSLKAAYHIQCMTCHETARQKPDSTQCDSCHQPAE